jgi:hypothetical protein
MLSKHIEQLERLEVTENDKALRGASSQGSTYLAHTHNDVGGRFAAISSPVVVGEKQIPQYPAAFLQHDPVPDENPLGVDVNALEPCGEPHELRASELKATLGPSVVSSAKAPPNPAYALEAPSLGERDAGLAFSSHTFRRF